MQYRKLGRTGIEVSQISLGGLFISRTGGDLEQSRQAVHRAMELGINYVDTAPTYYNSEEVLGQILPGVKEPFALSTKLGGRPHPFDPRDVRALRQSVEESLRLMHRDHIDLLYVHEPDRPGQYDWWSDWDAVHGPVLELLADLKREGVIRHTGVGGTTAYEMAHLIRSGKFDVVLTAFNYSVLWREAEIEVLPAAKEMGVGVVCGSPLQQGALARRYDEQVRAGLPWLSSPRRKQFLELYRYVDEIGIPLPELGIRFVLSNPVVSCVLTGARSKQEVEQNVAAAEKGPLAPAILHRLDDIAAMVPFRPFCEPFCFPFGGGYKGPGMA